MKVDHNLESMIVDGLSQKLTERRERAESIERPETLTGKQWLRERLSRGRFGICEEHAHAECLNCGVTKCIGGERKRFEAIDQVCDCARDPTEHLIVPFDNFGQHVRF